MDTQTMKPKLLANIEELGNEIAELHNAIDALAPRLDPVLGPEMPMVAENMKGQASTPTLLSERLAHLTGRVSAAKDKLGRLTERLEI